MGKLDQVISDQDFKDLKEEEREALQALVSYYVQNSDEIREIISSNERIREILRQKIGPMHDRLKGK
jgi:hypothetical protein